MATVKVTSARCNQRYAGNDVDSALLLRKIDEALYTLNMTSARGCGYYKGYGENIVTAH
jgi:hypothetical protein